MKKIKSTLEYTAFIGEIKERIHQAQYQAFKKVNKELINLYWDIGAMIVSRQKKHGWGKAIVENLSKDLQVEFNGVSGFSSSGLWRMRNFYLAYSRSEKLAPMVREISWSHNIVIFERCKNDLEREFYIRMTKRMGWTKSVLIHQIENQSYEKMVINQTNFKKTLPARIRNQAKLAVKDEYAFDFLELAQEHNEKELERALMLKINRFLIEMGGALTFVGNQFRVQVAEQEYFIDILLYHRHLKSLIAIELKIGEFKPEFAGKMQFYLAVLDDVARQKDENPSIGIILCKSKKRMIVEYALKESNKPIAVAKYIVTKTLPEKFKKELPAPEQIIKLFESIDDN
ncbi:MAG: PDDEXK nuclease domain-containing protein [Candidatus Omnitrophota bacterium]